MKLKRLSEQTMVITGATSGIGLTTARMAARQGAQLLLVARNEGALRALADEINAAGGRAIYAATDVADENALRQAARKAVEEFGGVDTWVNNAGSSIYGRTGRVSANDPLTFAGVALLLAFVAFVACLVTAWRVSKVIRFLRCAPNNR